MFDLEDRNPYFIGINSAIETVNLLNEFYEDRNPYFIGINSAIKERFSRTWSEYDRNPYFIGINSAIKVISLETVNTLPSQSLFYWN